MTDLNQIDKVEAFHDLAKSTKEKIALVAVEVELKKGETLFWEKDQVDAVYALVDGKAALLRYSGSGQKRIFFILDKGELINEVVFDNLPVSVVCEAFEEAKLLKLPKSDFLEIMKMDFDLTYKIMCSMGKKQRRLYRQLKNTVPIKVDKKLAAKLWKLSKDYGIKEGEWLRIDLNMSVTNLSYLMGSSRETISRALKTLIDHDIVKWDKKQILVREKEVLEYYRSY